MSRHFYQNICFVLLLAFVWFLILWESVWAPIRPGGSWLILKCLPLCFLMFGILKGKRKTFQKLSLVLQFYFLESLVRIVELYPVNLLSFVEFLFSLILFVVLVLFLKAKF